MGSRRKPSSTTTTAAVIAALDKRRPTRHPSSRRRPPKTHLSSHQRFIVMRGCNQCKANFDGARSNCLPTAALALAANPSHKQFIFERGCNRCGANFDGRQSDCSCIFCALAAVFSAALAAAAMAVCLQLRSHSLPIVRSLFLLSQVVASTVYCGVSVGTLLMLLLLPLL